MVIMGTFLKVVMKSSVATRWSVAREQIVKRMMMERVTVKQ